MRVLGLDPSLTNFGWAVYNTKATRPEDVCEASGRFQTSSKQLFVARYMDMRKHVQELVRETGVVRVGCEYPIFNDLWSEGMYGLFLYTCEALFSCGTDLVFFTPPQIKAHARTYLNRPRVDGKLWKMGKHDMVEAARNMTGRVKTLNHNEADAFWVARTAARFWQFFDGEIAKEDLTEDELKQFAKVHTYTRGKKAGRTIRSGLMYRENERFFQWARGEEDGFKRNRGTEEEERTTPENKDNSG